MADYDSPWKEALDVYFGPFLALFFPHIHRDIDWSRHYEMLDKELQQLLPKAAQGRRTVDKLVKVWRKNGAEAGILIHIEVQTRRERGFGPRMFVYNSRIADRYNRDVVSLAVLADEDPNWRPDNYEWELWGCRKGIWFPPAKLLDYANRERELEESRNPFAKVVLAHLKALATHRDPEDRRVWKLRLVRGLYERGFRAEDVRQLFRVIDWLMELPEAMEAPFWDEVDALQKERAMPFVSTPERVGIRIGLRQAIEDVLRIKFGDRGVGLMPQVNAIHNADQLRALLSLAVTTTNFEEVSQAFLRTSAPPPTPKTKTRKNKRRDA
jgi:hypothetical protein